MDFTSLKYFLTVAREQNITLAANLLHITQPALSRRMMQLEEELNQQLLERNSRHVRLTPQGRRFQKLAADLVAHAESVKNELQSLNECISGDIYIGCGETTAFSEIAKALNRLHENFPHINSHIYSGNQQDVSERLDVGLLDFGLLIEPADLTGCDFIQLKTINHWGVIMRSDCPLAQKSQITQEDLSGLPLICSRQMLEHSAHQNTFLSWFHNQDDQLNITSTFNLVYNAANMVSEGVGHDITIDGLIPSVCSDLCFRPLSPALYSANYFVWKKDRIHSAAANLLIQELLKTDSDS